MNTFLATATYDFSGITGAFTSLSSDTVTAAATDVTRKFWTG
jgi:hypothetical protein